MSSNTQASRRMLLAAAGTTVALAAARPALAAEADEAAVKAALEQFRSAVQTGDAATLGRLLHDQLSYGHSTGRKIQTKPEFIADVAGKTNYRSIAFTEITVRPVDDDAIVRHVWDAMDMQPNGGTRSYIAILQMWRKQGGNWVMLARQSCPLKDA